MARWQTIQRLLLGVMFVLPAWGQSGAEQPPSTTDTKNVEQEAQQRHERGPGKEIGSGAGSIGTGAAKGTGALAKGTAQGAGNLATLHPLRAGTSVGKGAAHAGKDLTVGTVKGTGKIAHGIGRAFKKLF